MFVKLVFAAMLELVVLVDDSNIMEVANDVNLKYNVYEYISDAEHFKKHDYWQSPHEFSTYKRGDCEDFAIAKYYDLRNIGVPEDRLLIVYSRHIPKNEAHMVLFVLMGNEWFVLDNITNVIKPARERTDLEFVYGFNTTVNFDMRKAKWREWDLSTDANIPVERLKRLIKDDN